MKISLSFEMSRIACTVSLLDLQFHAKCAFGMQEWLNRDASKKIPRFSLPVAESLPIWKLLASKRVVVLGAGGQLSAWKPASCS